MVVSSPLGYDRTYEVCRARPERLDVYDMTQIRYGRIDGLHSRTRRIEAVAMSWKASTFFHKYYRLGAFTCKVSLELVKIILKTLCEGGYFSASKVSSVPLCLIWREHGIFFWAWHSQKASLKIWIVEKGVREVLWAAKNDAAPFEGKRTCVSKPLLTMICESVCEVWDS